MLIFANDTIGSKLLCILYPNTTIFIKNIIGQGVFRKGPLLYRHKYVNELQSLIANNTFKTRRC